MYFMQNLSFADSPYLGSVKGENTVLRQLTGKKDDRLAALASQLSALRSQMGGGQLQDKLGKSTTPTRSTRASRALSPLSGVCVFTAVDPHIQISPPRKIKHLTLYFPQHRQPTLGPQFYPRRAMRLRRRLIRMGLLYQLLLCRLFLV